MTTATNSHGGGLILVGACLTYEIGNSYLF